MLDLASQIWVTVFGLAALGLMQLERTRVRRWGVVLGLCGQPAWYCQLVIHEQWGMLPVFVGYTGLWVFGAWNLWVRPWRERRARLRTIRATEAKWRQKNAEAWAARPASPRSSVSSVASVVDRASCVGGGPQSPLPSGAVISEGGRGGGRKSGGPGPALATYCVRGSCGEGTR